MTRASVTVVVPTKNAARTLRACLESIARQSVRCGLVVVDCGSVDDSKAIASGFADLVLDTAPNPSLQRNAGARALPADIIGFIDADMVVGGHVVEQAIEQIAAGAGSVVVPERSFGERLLGEGPHLRALHVPGDLGVATLLLLRPVRGARWLRRRLDSDGGHRPRAARKHPCKSRQDVGCASPRRGRADLPRGMPQEGPLRDRDRRLPPQARKPSVGVASQAPVLRAPVARSSPSRP